MLSDTAGPLSWPGPDPWQGKLLCQAQWSERGAQLPQSSHQILLPRKKVRRVGEEGWVSSTFAVLAISSQLEAGGAGTAVRAKCVLACVLA